MAAGRRALLQRCQDCGSLDTLGHRRRGDVFTFAVSEGARLPISPDWSGSLGLEFRSEKRLLEAQPFARFDYSYTGASVNSLAGIESVVFRQSGRDAGVL